MSIVCDDDIHDQNERTIERLQKEIIRLNALLGVSAASAITKDVEERALPRSSTEADVLVSRIESALGAFKEHRDSFFLANAYSKSGQVVVDFPCGEDAQRQHLHNADVALDQLLNIVIDVRHEIITKEL